MPSTLHFISGLPRSGSTLLSALLLQNPRFYAAVTSPVSMLCSTLLPRMSGNTEFSVFFDRNRRQAILQGIFLSYYLTNDDKVIFDTNRSWTGKMALTSELFPKSRVICCVREVEWILDSLERAFNKEPTQVSRIFNYGSTSSVYARIELLMNSENGLVGQAWSTFREAWFGENANRLIVIPYEKLARHPAQVLARLYQELQERPFEHNFDHVEYDAPEFDNNLASPGLHTVEKTVRFVERSTCLPPDIAIKYADLNFWKKSSLNPRGVKVL